MRRADRKRAEAVAFRAEAEELAAKIIDRLEAADGIVVGLAKSFGIGATATVYKEARQIALDSGRVVHSSAGLVSARHEKAKAEAADKARAEAREAQALAARALAIERAERRAEAREAQKRSRALDIARAARDAPNGHLTSAQASEVVGLSRAAVGDYARHAVREGWLSPQAGRGGGYRATDAELPDA